MMISSRLLYTVLAISLLTSSKLVLNVCGKFTLLDKPGMNPSKSAQSSSDQLQPEPLHSPSRHLTQWWGADIVVENKCRFPVKVLVQAKLGNDENTSYCRNYETSAGEWCIRGWYTLQPDQKQFFVYTKQDHAYYHAEIASNPSYTWGNGGVFETDRGDACFEGDDSCLEWSKWNVDANCFLGYCEPPPLQLKCPNASENPPKSDENPGDNEPGYEIYPYPPYYDEEYPGYYEPAPAPGYYYDDWEPPAAAPEYPSPPPPIIILKSGEISLDMDSVTPASCKNFDLYVNCAQKYSVETRGSQVTLTPSSSSSFCGTGTGSVSGNSVSGKFPDGTSFKGEALTDKGLIRVGVPVEGFGTCTGNYRVVTGTVLGISSNSSPMGEDSIPDRSGSLIHKLHAVAVIVLGGFLAVFFN